MTQERYDVTGMTCAACQAHVQKAVNALPGVRQVSVNLLTNSMTVEYDESDLNSHQIVQAVEQAGYGATPRAREGYGEGDVGAGGDAGGQGASAVPRDAPPRDLGPSCSRCPCSTWRWAI